MEMLLLMAWIRNDHIHLGVNAERKGLWCMVVAFQAMIHTNSFVCCSSYTVLKQSKGISVIS